MDAHKLRKRLKERGESLTPALQRAWEEVRERVERLETADASPSSQKAEPLFTLNQQEIQQALAFLEREAPSQALQIKREDAQVRIVWSGPARVRASGYRQGENERESFDYQMSAEVMRGNLEFLLSEGSSEPEMPEGEARPCESPK